MNNHDMSPMKLTNLFLRKELERAKNEYEEALNQLKSTAENAHIDCPLQSWVQTANKLQDAESRYTAIRRIMLNSDIEL